MLAAWEFWRRRRSGSTVAAHVVFLAACFVPAGIASVAVLRVLPFDAVTAIRNPLFWPVVFVAGAVPLVFAMRRPRAASRAMRGVLLYSWPVLALILGYAARNLFRFPEAAFADAPLAATLPGDGKSGTRHLGYFR